MENTNPFEKTDELQRKFYNLVGHKKKVKALENYSEVGTFKHNDYLLLLRKCISEGFLGEVEADFLTYMIKKYDVNFLDWSHKTKWLKEEIERLGRLSFQMQQYHEFKKYHDYVKAQPTQSMPASMVFDMVAAKCVYQHQGV